MAVANTEHLDRIVEYIRRKRGEEVSLADVIGLAEITAESVHTLFESMDNAIYRELREIAGYIANMRQEISALQVNDLKESRIPAAGLELSAIVKATEDATNTIMECAETLMSADAGDPAAYKALVEDRMMVIFEACSFQDITGQRVAKVVETLQHIESRVARFATAISAKDVEGFVSDQERARAERRERLLLNGPQLHGHGVGQADVDALLGGAPNGSSQSAIDRLFP